MDIAGVVPNKFSNQWRSVLPLPLPLHVMFKEHPIKDNGDDFQSVMSHWYLVGQLPDVYVCMPVVSSSRKICDLFFSDQ